MKRRTGLCCLAILVTALINTAAAAETEAGVHFYSEAQDAVVPAPVVASLVHLEVTGIIARGTVTQIFYNPTDEWLSGVYLFPLPENAVVDALKMRVGDRALEARIAEREAAKARYDEARKAGVKATLLAQQRADAFTTSVAQVGPGEEVEIEIGLHFEVRYDDGRFRLRFPLLVAERYKSPGGSCAVRSTTDESELAASLPAEPALPSPPRLQVGDRSANPVAFRIDLASGYALDSVTSPTHPIRVVERPRFAYAIELAEELTPADSDFVLEWAPALDALPRVHVAIDERDDYTYALLTVWPPAGLSLDRLARPPREVIFVVDTSGSMEGTSLEQAKQALTMALDDLMPFDRFNVIRFSNTFESLFPAAVAADPEAVEAAGLWVSGLEDGGGTEMLPALVMALEGGEGRCYVCPPPGEPGLLRQVVFVTDGEVENEQAIFARVRAGLGASRLFTVGIGSTPNGYFMRRVAELGRGTYTFISDPSEVAGRMTALLRKLTTPVLTDVEVLFDDPTSPQRGANAILWPERSGDLYLGEPLVVVARLDRLAGPRQEHSVRLSARRGDELLELTVPLAGATPGVAIDQLWARRQVTALAESLIDGADLDEVRRQTVELALAHSLVTRYTSLIAVDGLATGEAGEAAAERLLPIHSPRGRQLAASAGLVASSGGGGGSWSGPDGELMEELIVTGEAPMIDSSIHCPAAVVRDDDLSLLPVAREPWSLVARAPGVVIDRQPGDGTVDPPRFSGRGAMSDQNAVRLDGFEITEDSSGESSFELGKLSLQEVRVTSGGAVGDASTPGLHIDLTTSEGYNPWRGAGRATALAPRGGGTDAQTSGNRLRESSSAELELGGRLWADHLWLWGAFSDSESERDVGDGACVDCAPPVRGLSTDLDHATGKLKGGSPSFSLSATWHRGAASEEGHGAGPDRTPDAAWDHDGQARLLVLEANLVATPEIFLSAGYGELDRRLEDLPVGGLGTEARLRDATTDGAGVTSSTTFARTGARETDDGYLTGHLYLDFPKASHELKAGARRRRHAAADRWVAGGARWVETGDNVTFQGEASDAMDLLTSWHDSFGQTDVEHRAGWLQDTFRFGWLTVIAGLRWDEQQGTNRFDVAGLAPGAMLEGAAVAGADWRGLAPRLGLTLALDGSGRTLLRAAYGRYTSRLGPALALRLGDGFPVYDRELFTDADRDLVLDPEENASRAPWYQVRPDLLAPDLGPELTDQALLGFEYELGYRFVAGVTLSHRRSYDLLERRTLVREAGGEPRQATVSDWLPAGSLSDGNVTPVYFDLRPGLELVPSGLWVNGDRRRETRAASLTWRGHLGDRWQTQGHFSWNDARWHLGDEFLRFDDPTDTAGSGDDDGDRVVELEARDRLGTTELAADSRWSFHWGAGVELPWDLDLGFAVNGREGYPLPYFQRVARDRAGIAAVELTDRADALRAPDVVTFDARLAKELTFGDLGISLVFEAFNLLGADDVLRRELDLGVSRGGAPDETVTPRAWRLGVRLGWN